MKRKYSPVPTICKNCGTQTQGRYCHVCGQDLFKGVNRSIKDLTLNFFENIFVLDNKLLKTLALLIYYPGKLSSEYVKGRIVSYVHPSKLFWFITIIFFTLLIGRINWGEFSNVSNLKDSVSAYGPYVSFIMIPVFALCLLLLFRNKSRYYIDHLTFALHFHAFVFLLLSIHFLILKFFNPFYSNLWVVLYIPIMYLVVALYVFYRPKTFSLVWKTVVFSIIYSLLLFAIFVLIALLIAGYINID